MKSVYLEKIKELGITKIILILFAGILLVVSSFDMTGSIQKDSTTFAVDDTNSAVSIGSVELSGQIEEILGTIYGVNSVNVLITYEDTGEKILIGNETNEDIATNESDSQGGTRVENRNSYTTEYVRDSNDDPYVINKLNPKICGVLVVYQGEAGLKSDITEAVNVLTGVGVNNIKVITKN